MRENSLESQPHTEFSGGRYPDITTKLKSVCFDINFIAKIPSSIDSIKYSSKTEFLINIPILALIVLIRLFLKIVVTL